MSLRIVQVDAFTDRRFAGNPAAVCVLSRERDAVWMQQVALEMNLSETSFLVADEESYRLRWFTPVSEVDLCGHATLASGWVILERLEPVGIEQVGVVAQSLHHSVGEQLGQPAAGSSVVPLASSMT